MTAADRPWQHGDIVRIRGARWRLVQCLPYESATVLDAEGGETTNGAERGRFLVPFERVDRVPAPHHALRVVSARRWRRAARLALAGVPARWDSLRAAARASFAVMPFQLEPAIALARGEACRFLLADAVGLGKTVQAGLMLAEWRARRPDSRALVVSPAGLREQWRQELDTRFGLAASVLDAAGVARAGQALPADVNPWAMPPLAIASIDYIKRPEVMRCLEPLVWDVVILDEAHALTGRSDRAAAAAALGTRARVLIMLTATPHSGDEDAFRRLCQLGDVGDGRPLVAFQRTRGDAGIAASRRSVFLRVAPTADEARMHDALAAYARCVWHQSAERHGGGARLAVAVLVRRAASSASSLARSVERRLALLASSPVSNGEQLALPFAAASRDDDEPWAVLGAQGLDDAREELAHLARLLELARAAARAESKVAALQRLLSRSREPAIVFTEYRDTLERLAPLLGDAVPLHGGLTSAERADALRRFTAGDARLLLATDAASEGLNLHQRCRRVINLELPWTPTRLEQRIGRVDRIGQPHRVHALHLVAGGTGEEAVLARLARRVAAIERARQRMGPLPTDSQIADMVIGDDVLPDVEPMANPPAMPGVGTIDLHSASRDEAARVTEARRWLSRSPHAPTHGADVFDDRPAAAWIRRRRGRRTSPQCIWLFKLSAVAADRRLVAEALLAIHARATGQPPRTAVATRMLLEPRLAAIPQLVRTESERRCRDLEEALRAPLDLWLRRERAIADAARERQARLAAALVQGALFDRRTDRLAAAQEALLQHALLGSAERLAQLAACRHLTIGACDLLCAVVLE